MKKLVLMFVATQQYHSHLVVTKQLTLKKQLQILSVSLTLSQQ